MVYPEKVIPLRLCLLSRLHLENENKWKFILHFARFALPLHVLITKGMPRQTRRKSGTGIYHVILCILSYAQSFPSPYSGTYSPHWRNSQAYGILGSSDFQKLNKQQRNEIIKSLCNKGAGARQLSRITGISYGIIQRVKE